MRTGQLRQRIDIEAPTVGDDAYDTTTWATVATDIPANVRAEKSDERIRANRIAASLAYIIVIRKDAAEVTSNMRIIYGDRILHVTGPPHEIGEKLDFLEIMAVYEG